MSVSPLRMNSKKSNSLYLHVWQILNKIISFLMDLSVKLPRVISLKFRECFDCVFGVIIVPRDPVVT